MMKNARDNRVSSENITYQLRKYYLPGELSE